MWTFPVGSVAPLPCNPDELDTLPRPAGLLPRVPPPAHIASVLAEITMNPPWVDHTMQYKKTLKPWSPETQTEQEGLGLRCFFVSIHPCDIQDPRMETRILVMTVRHAPYACVLPGSLIANVDYIHPG